KLSSTMLRTVLSEATVKSMDVDQVRIPLDDVRSAHEALVGGRRRGKGTALGRAKGETFVVPRTGRGSLAQDPHRIPNLLNEFSGLSSEQKGQFIFKLYSEGNTYREIADTLALSHQEVRLLSLGWKNDSDSNSGVSDRRELNKLQLQMRRRLEIYMLHKQGQSANQIAEKFGITPTRIKQILASEDRRHRNEPASEPNEGEPLVENAPKPVRPKG
ncbi:helix-turn-helix domain-containing protein, partial [Trinickia sp. EG282A]|uniref:helix-turn-helix domain-containing protein n=1 Tax=Trinickia sp. EG282A TaxID=3237013 RepID=UPI0034D295BA